MIHLNSNHGEWKVNPAVVKKASSLKHEALCIFQSTDVPCFYKGLFSLMAAYMPETLLHLFISCFFPSPPLLNLNQ